jgi:hypothetical protein
MAIDVYWTCVELEWMRAQEPISIYKKYINSPQMKNSGVDRCPATFDYLRNIYGLKSIYDFDFKVGETLEAMNYSWDPKFVERHVTIRSLEQKLFSVPQRYVFFTEEDSLLMSAGLHPFLEENHIAKNCAITPGIFDIGKWFRVIDFAFYLKNNENIFSVKDSDIFMYLQFHTDKRIRFKQFISTPKIENYTKDIVSAKNYIKLGKMKKLGEFYSMQKNKKFIIKEIKENLIKG